MKTGTPRPHPPAAEDRPIRRTWWLLSGAFLVLGLITGLRALTSGAALDWIPVAAVGVAALAAVVHRNAVASLEARGRVEVESFARILRGLSRSVSVDAIVGAIVDDLAEGTGADHIVVVRRRPEGAALEATLVTRRPGVPSTSTVLPLMDLESPLDREPPPAVPVPIDTTGVEPGETSVGGLVGALAGAASGSSAGAAIGSSTGAAIGASVTSRTGGTVNGRIHGTGGEIAPHPIGPPGGPHARRGTRAEAGSPAGTAVRAAGRLVDGARAWLAGILDDLDIAHPLGSGGPLLAPRSEVMGSGATAAVAARIADRVRSFYGLSHTLAAPLRTEAGVIGAIVLSRRDREPWPQAARRLLEGAAVEAAAAMARAYSYREVAAHASTDPLTGLPNRRYFDEFCGLLARRRRAGDAVAVLMVDIDRFKILNDTYGHPVGDEVLKAVAGAIITGVREEDVPARVGGEEFAVLLRNPGPDVAIEVGERVRQAVRELDLTGHGVPGVSVSVGVAHALGPNEPIPAIVDRADQALLRAKRAGRDRVIAG